MGMYTGFHGQARIKPEYHDFVKDLLFWYEQRGTGQVGDRPEVPQWLWYGADFEKAHRFLSSERAQWFFSWMVASESYFKDISADEYPLSFVNGVLRFEGAIKNYDDEVDKFAELLDIIAVSPFMLEMEYEEWYGKSTYQGNGKWSEHKILYDDYGPTQRLLGE